MTQQKQKMRVGETVRVTPSNCPHCNQHLDAAAGLKESETDHAMVPTPEESITLCLHCGEWSMFTEMGLRKLTDEEHIEIAHQPSAVVARRTYMEMQKRGVIDRIREATLKSVAPGKPAASGTAHLLGLHRKSDA